MPKRPILIAIILLSAGCAHNDPLLPTCDGSERRPANPNGSVLDPISATPVASAGSHSALAEGGCA